MAKRDVKIEISAQDRTSAGLKSAESALKKFQNAQQATQSRRAAFSGAEKDAKDLYKAYQDAADGAETLGRKMAAAKRPSAQLKTEFAAAREEVRRTKTEFLAAGVAFGRMNGRISAGTGSFAQFEQTVTALRSQTAAANQTGDALESLARDLPKVAAAQQRVTAETRNATNALNAQAAASGRGRKGGGVAQGELEALTSAKGRGFLGLRPYEVQNLSYQVNDLFTQIAGGTPITQAFAQQGGQIAQLFPQAALGILRMLPAIALVTAAVAPFVSALIEVENRAKSLKVFDVALTASGNGANYSKEQLATLATTLDGLGGSLGDAQAALKNFVGDAVAPAYLERFGRSAINLAKVLKIDVTDAAEQVSTAFTGNASDILALDDTLNFLTKSERKQIEALKESGREAEARTQAFAIFERRYQETANKMSGPWDRILKNFGGAWKAFVNYVNFIDFSAIKAEINGLLGLIERLTSRLPGARQAGVGGILSEITNQQKRLRDLQNAPAPGLAGAIGVAAARGLATNRLRAAQAELRAYNAAARARTAETPTDTTTRPPPVPDRPSARSSGVSDAQRLAKAQQEFNDDLDAANIKRALQVELIDKSAREVEALTAIEEARARAADAGLKFTDEQAVAIRESVTGLYDAQRAAAGRETIERSLLALAERRGEVETQEAYIQRGLREAGLEAITETDAATGEVTTRLTEQSVQYAAILRQQYQMDQNARDIAASEKSVNDLLTQRSELQSQLTFAQEQGDTTAAEALQIQLDSVNAKLLQAVNSAIEFHAALGGPNAVATILALQGVAMQLGATGQEAVITGKHVNEMTAGGLASAFDRFAQQVVETRDLIGSLRDAFLQFAADFLRQIAQIIIQRTILNIVDGAGGGGGGGIGGAIAGVVGRLFHTGGVVGQSAGPKRTVNPSAFLGATRYHTGGMAGFASDEVPAILKKNEEVLTESDPRHRNNAAGGGSTTVVNVFDPADFLERALSGAGERILLNHVSQNSQAFKAAIG